VSEASRLTAAGLAIPDYGGKELGAVLPGALAAVGAGAAVPHRDAEADRERLGIPTARHVVIVMIDGLGHFQLAARRGHAPFLRSIESGQVTAGFPTTTATSITLFGTGEPAGRTGMIGYTARNERTGGLANLVSWEGAYSAEEWQPRPSLLQCAAEEGFRVTTLGRRNFAGSGLTQAALLGGQFVGAELLADRIDVALGAAQEPGISYCYWGEIDAAGHKFGWNSDEWVASLEDADRELSRLARALPRDAALVVTADHGMIDVTGAPRWDVATHSDLARDVDLISGEPRALHLHTGPDAAQAVAARWQDVLGEHGVVLTREEAVASGIFGTVEEVAASRLGDVEVVMTGRATVVDSRTQSPGSLALIGAHGSLTPEELIVPLLIAEAA
jgi:hypothetical protein